MNGAAREALCMEPCIDTGRSWRRVYRVAEALMAATAVVRIAFAYRFNGEQPLRDLADAEPRGAWPPRVLILGLACFR